MSMCVLALFGVYMVGDGALGVCLHAWLGMEWNGMKRIARCAYRLSCII